MSTREPTRIPLKDPEADKAVDETRRAIIELARSPFVNGRDLDVVLQPNVHTVVKHGLGRKFINYTLSAPRGGGVVVIIVEHARTDESVTLEAQTAGAAVTVGMRIW